MIVQLNENATLKKREKQDNVHDKAEINYSRTCAWAKYPNKTR